MAALSIGEVAQRSGLPASTLRYYEQAGLLPRAVRVSGQRRFAPPILERLAVIRFAREAGFTLAEVRDLFGRFPASSPPPARWQKLARAKLEEAEAMIRRAQAMKKLLEAGLECRCLSIEECGRLIQQAEAAGLWTSTKRKRG